MNKSIRVLHSGNIANNGYLNSKILNTGTGFDSICLSADYYHIMGTPQWEEDIFNSAGIDQNKPNWNTISTKLEVSDSFLSGPFNQSCRYLEYKITGKKIRSKILKFSIDLQALRKKNILGNQFIFLVKLYFFLERQLLLRKRFLNPIFYLYKIFKIKYPQNYFMNNDISTIWDRTKKVVDIGDDLIKHSCFIIEVYNFKRLSRFFDVIHCYGLDPKYPYLAGVNQYIAFEHGTIRDIPFLDTFEGRLCRKSYLGATHVFITNSDNLIAAQKIGLKSYTFIPHPINDLEVNGQLDFGREVDLLFEKMDRSEFVIFHPTRHHWEEVKKENTLPSWLKGNQKLISAFGEFVKSGNESALCILVDWGQTVNDSKILIEKLGIEKNVCWIDPVPHKVLIAIMKRSNVVADQFYLGAFGSITAKSIGLGIPVLVYLEEDEVLRMFEEMPPINNVQTKAEIVSAIYEISKRENVQQDNLLIWYKKYHSQEKIREKLIEGYDKIIGGVRS